jgi:hypothetical protein
MPKPRETRPRWQYSANESATKPSAEALLNRRCEAASGQTAGSLLSSTPIPRRLELRDQRATKAPTAADSSRSTPRGPDRAALAITAPSSAALKPRALRAIDAGVFAMIHRRLGKRSNHAGRA